MDEFGQINGYNICISVNNWWHYIFVMDLISTYKYLTSNITQTFAKMMSDINLWIIAKFTQQFIICKAFL